MRIRLREILREDMGGTYGVGVSGNSSKNPREEYSYTISFGTSPDRLEEMVDSVFVAIERLKTDGPTQEDVDKVKEQQRRSNETNLRNNGYWIGQINARVSSGSGNLADIPLYIDYVDALTAEDIQAAARLYLNLENYVRVSLYPEETSEGGGS